MQKKKRRLSKTTTYSSNFNPNRHTLLSWLVLLSILFKQSVLSYQCGYTDEMLFPKSIGADQGETYVLAMDFQIHPTTPNIERLAFGGYSSDSLFFTEQHSAFIFYEDALNSKVLWAKELSSIPVHSA